MSTGKLCLAVLLGAMPATVTAQPSVRVDVGVNVAADRYDDVAPGDPVESVDVFYDQLSPYGVWVDEPDVGRVFIPDTASFVPYAVGHWQYTNVGFVWISTEPFAWATTHYGRWAYSRYFGRWYWLPDTAWGPSWVEWRMTDGDFGWAPLPPDVVVRAGWQPPVEAWHYCGAEHVLDPNLTRYYVPRERVVEIHRSARPLEHFATISNVRVAVGPPAATLREHRVAVHRVQVQPRTLGRWTAGEARAQVTRARDHRATFEVQNQRRIESNTRIRTAQTKVIEAHPQIRAQVTARIHGDARPDGNRAAPAAQPPRVEPGRVQDHRAPTEPNRPAPAAQPPRAEPDRPAPSRAEPDRRPEPNRAEPSRPEPERRAPESRPADRPRQPPTEMPRPEPSRRPDPNRAEPNRPEPERRAEPPRSEPNRRPEPNRAEPNRPEPERRAEPPRSEPNRPAQPERRAEPPRSEPNRPAQPPRVEPNRPAPPRAEPSRPEPVRRGEPERAAPAPEPRREQNPPPAAAPRAAEPERPRQPPTELPRPERKDPDRKDPDRDHR